MAQISRPKLAQNQDQITGGLQLGGAVAGAFEGGPSGAAKGAQAGGTAGGIINSLAPAAQPAQSQEVEAPGDSAMRRRLQELDNDPGKQIADSINSLQYIQDPQQRAELARPLLQANYMAQNKGRV